MEPITTKKTLYRRDTKTYTFTLKRKGVPINLTGYTPYFSAKTVPDGTSLFSKAGSIVTAAEGTCQVTLSSADLATTCENGIAEVMVESAAGLQDTLGQFYIDIVKDIKTT